MSDASQDRSGVLLSITWMWTAVASIFVGARFYTRKHYTGKLWWDDFWILVALGFSLGMSIIWTVYASKGGAKHFDALTLQQIVETSRLNWISQILVIGGLVTGKLSVMSMIKRLQSPNRIRTTVLWVFAIILVLYTIVEIVLIFTQCSPVYALWDPASAPDAKCLPPAIVTNNAIAASCYLAFLDLALAAIPVQMIWNLQIPRRRKIAICCLLSTGIFAFVIAVIKITELTNDSARADFTWATVLLFVWNACEINIVIVAACIPTLMPLFEAITGHHPVKGSSAQRRGGLGNGGSSGGITNGSRFRRNNYLPGSSWSNGGMHKLRDLSSDGSKVNADSGREALVYGVGQGEAKAAFDTDIEEGVGNDEYQMPGRF